MVEEFVGPGPAVADEGGSVSSYVGISHGVVDLVVFSNEGVVVSLVLV